MPAPLIVCADDYALAPGVSRGILDLIELGRLSATGAMTVSAYWPEHGGWLRPWASRVAVGLHFTLTDHRPLGPMPKLAPEGRLPALKTLIATAHRGQLDSKEIGAELSRQLARFSEVFAAPPAFIDGHQHVHLLPVVREAVITAAAESPGLWLRDCREPLPAILRRGVAVTKALVIAQLGNGFGRLLARRGLPANRGFRGIYDFSGRVPFSTLIGRFLDPPGRQATQPPLLMVHPGLVDQALRALDPVTDQRRVEYDFLASDGFATLLAARSWRVATLPLRFASHPPEGRPLA